MGCIALLHKSADGRTDLSQGLRDGYAKRGVAVQAGDAELEFSGLSVDVSRHQPLTRKLHTMHLRFDAAPAVVSAPSSPQGAEIMRGNES